MEVAYAQALSQSRSDAWKRGTAVPLNRLESTNLDLLSALTWFRHDSLAELNKKFQDLTGRNRIILAPSGQCAIAQILASLPQKEVVIPACTCSVVKTAALAAGKRIIYVDLAKGSVNAGVDEFAAAARPGRILLPTHQFGVPAEIEGICKLARDRDCVVVEDSVAAFGGYWHGKALGTFGDFGVFSFHRAKRLPAFRGGIIIINNEKLAAASRIGSARLAVTQCHFPLRDILNTFAYNLATIPWVYGNVVVPQLLGRYRDKSFGADCSEQTQTEEDQIGSANNQVLHTPDYTREVHPYQAEVVLRILTRIESIQERISALSDFYIRALRDTPWQIFVPSQCDFGGLLRLPVAMPSQQRTQTLRVALQQGLYLEVEYETLLVPQAERAQFPNASWIADNLMLLPLYRALSPQMAESFVRKLVRVARSPHEVGQPQLAYAGGAGNGGT